MWDIPITAQPWRNCLCGKKMKMKTIILDDYFTWECDCGKTFNDLRFDRGRIDGIKEAQISDSNWDYMMGWYAGKSEAEKIRQWSEWYES